MTSRAEGLCVYVRVRPPIFKEVREDTAVHVNGSQSLTLVSESKEISCSYDLVFNEITEQKTVFDKVQPLLVDVLSGINCCIFAYGQTSAGKSYTMIGPNGGQDVLRCDKDEWGILPRASEFLLGYLNEKSNEGMLTYEVKASFLQIYNENLYDLLRDTGPMIEDKLLLNDNKDSELKIREIPKVKGKSKDEAKEVFVSGLSEFRVQTSEDILRILAVGTSNRMTRSTDFNSTSSRSHAILQLTFEIESHLESGQTLISRSKLNLIDLAGSEKIPFVNSDMNSNAKHMKELTSINKSLSSLGNVIAALSSNNRTHIPYRDSKLTRILQDSLSGNTRTILIACVAPTVLHTSESLSTLQFADRAKNVMLTVKSNTIVDDKVMLAKAQSEITRLKALLTHALKQLEQKSSISDNNNYASEVQRLMTENDSLRKENSSLRSSMLTSNSVGSFGSVQSNNRGMSLFGEVQSHLPSKKKKLSEEQLSRRASRESASGKPLLDTKILLDGMKGMKGKKSSYAAFSEYSGQAAAVEKPQIAFGRKQGAAKKRSTDYSSDSEAETPKNRKNKAKNGYNSSPSSDMEQYDAGVKKYTANESRVHSKLYKAINDRQIDELNHRLANANHIVEEQERDNMELDTISSLLGLPPRKGKENIHEQLYNQHHHHGHVNGQQQQQQQHQPVVNQYNQPSPQRRGNQNDDANVQMVPIIDDTMVVRKNPKDTMSGSMTHSIPDLNSVTVQNALMAASMSTPQIAKTHSLDSNDPRMLPPPESGRSNMSTTTDQYSGYTKISTPSMQKPESYQFAPTNRIVINKKGNGHIHHDGRDTSNMASRGSIMTPVINPNGNLPQHNGYHHQSAAHTMKGASASILAMGMMNNNIRMQNPQQQMMPPMSQHQHQHHSHGQPVSMQSAVDLPKANLTYSRDDIGNGVLIFSYRSGLWDEAQIMDYDENRRMHKVHIGGVVQWQDLSKKQVRDQT